MSKQAVLLVDDDKNLSEVLSISMEKQGRSVTTCSSVNEALAALQSTAFDVVLTDLRMPGKDGIELVKMVCAAPSHPPVVVFTAHGSLDAAVEAMRAGAVDFLAKPVSRDVLSLTLDRVVRSAQLEQENAVLKERLAKLADGPSTLIAAAPAMNAVVDLVDRVATSDVTVLLRGESGTGKELLAKRIHEKSTRAGQTFVPLNCAAVPHDLMESELFGHAKGAFTGASLRRSGRFEEANGGTLFLDEIGDLDLNLQAKLLRVLQDGVVPMIGGADRQVDVRIVSATHRDLEEMVEEGTFREDLFFRLSVVPVSIPPLRQRTEDIVPLFVSFVSKASARAGFEPPEIQPSLTDALLTRAWPGNVRELENVATRLTVSVPKGAPLSVEHLMASDGKQRRSEVTASSTALMVGGTVSVSHEGVSLDAVERALIVSALSLTNNNQSQAARLLRIPRHALVYRISKYSIGPGEVATLGGSGRAPIHDA